MARTARTEKPAVQENTQPSEELIALAAPEQSTQSVTAEAAELPAEDTVLHNDSESGQASEETASEQTEETEQTQPEADEFESLASLMNSTVENVKEEFFLYQIHKFMTKLGKVVVRYNVPEAELEKLFVNASVLNVNGIMVSPAYFAVCKRVKAKNKLSGKLCSIVDFPFGESTFKAKLTSMREGKGYGVEETTVMMPSMLVSEQNIKQFKKQCAAIGRRGNAGVALNATDLDEEAIKRAVKATNKTRLSYLTFVFGEATLDEVKSKMVMINNNKGLKKIYVLANVDNAEAVSELVKLGVDKVLTPFADDIGKSLFEKFKINSVKTV